ncbi:hypothetical protein [Alteromonas oceanisediminis]|uniref:hypothetical protein n=1 Tax=Alteromonas oceanisediminis TaxID=2836180 RepID=UPI001BDB6243|nr:hypothetical protein [Alteromonas oceanisediminis]MBT0585110.1 hypothetical protein [Alteromonas oceanisediminis]
MKTSIEYAVNGRSRNLSTKTERLLANVRVLHYFCINNSHADLLQVGKHTEQIIHHLNSLTVKFDELWKLVDHRVNAGAIQSINDDVIACKAALVEALNVESDEHKDIADRFMTAKSSLYGISDYFEDIEVIFESATIAVKAR